MELVREKQRDREERMSAAGGVVAGGPPGIAVTAAAKNPTETGGIGQAPRIKY